MELVSSLVTSGDEKEEYLVEIEKTELEISETKKER